MASPTAPHGRTGRPPLTSRAQIVAAARQIIERDGWEKLTVRRLAAEIGVGATTLYHHVRSKEDLLVLVLNHYLGQVERPALPNDPRERIIAAAGAMHDAAAAWPWAVEIVTTDGFLGLLDESALWMVEDIVAAAGDYGCTPAHAIVVFRSIWYYTAGEILVRANTARRRAGDLRHVTLSDLDASRLPHLAAISGQWAAVAQGDTYPQGLRALVDGLLAQATPAAP
ncbi:TetR/AcrR family transcriptional regulator [Spirillospora sp. NPDC048823]|uniref:TetR/AcrR family transcriptional regulator n=1 Tax=unclassified Spirillospora TaxID=2642701 RepID=UPI00371111FD